MTASLTRSMVVSLAGVALSNAAMGQQAAAPEASASQPGSVRVDTLDKVVVNGIRRGDLILPSTVSSSSAFGLDLSVLDTPRNNTILSRAQLDALNVKDPQSFSFLTASSYSDASFGVPNTPRIRGQYGDVFFNGMRDSFTTGGYGAPLSFNSIDSIDIVKGPASVQAGPGQGVGGAINITTKLPSFTRFGGSVSTEVDTIGHRRWNVDLGGPFSSNDAVAYRLSYSGEQSGSYWHDQYFHEQSLYGAVVANLSDKYQIQINSELSDSHYTENDGVNRVNQQLIDHGQYLTNVGPVDNLFGAQVTLGNPVQLDRRTNIDQAPGAGAHARRFNLQAIQTYEIDADTSLVNNTFFNHLDRYNEVEYYFADSARDTWTLENKTDFKHKFTTRMGGSTIGHAIDAGFSLRYAHVESIQSFLNEPVSTYDLTGDPQSWAFPPTQQAAGGAIAYTAPFGHVQYGSAARNPSALDASIVSNLYDAAVFMEHRIQFSPVLSFLYGVRADFVRLRESDPFDDPASSDPTLPRSKTTNWYTLGNGNASVVYRPVPAVSGYVTFNYAQYVNPNANDGGVGTFGLGSDAAQLRQATRLAETGLKFDLLDKKLFASTAIFEQARSIPTGPGGTQSSFAHIKGFEAELNFQPSRNFFATASYSYIRTTLDTPAPFYNYPAQAGANVDGAGVFAVFAPNQSFNGPGIPRQLFNLLANYKSASGFGVQANLQVTGSVETTTSGQLDLAASTDVPASIVANGGNYKSPVIPRQHTENLAFFYATGNYETRFTIYNLTDQHNVVNNFSFFGNDFLTRSTPRSFALTLKAKF